MEATNHPSTIDSWDRLDTVNRRQFVRGLRTLGYSYGEIAALVPLSKSTISQWCSGITLTGAQEIAIDARSGPRSRQGTSVDTQWRRRAEISRIRRAAVRYAGPAAGDPLFVAGVCLYWAEGSKTRNDLSITNSDPRVLSVFIRFVREHLDPLATFALALNLHSVQGEEAAKRYWVGELGLEGARFTKSYIKQPGTGHRRKRLPHGVCRVRVDKASDHWHRVMAWIDVVGRSLGD